MATLTKQHSGNTALAMASQPTPYLALGATVLFWGLSFISTKIALQFFPPFTLIFLRFSLASLFFIGMLIRRGFPSFTGREKGKLLLIALCEPGIYFACETLGLKLTAASKASLIIALVPIFTLLLARVILKEYVTGRQTAGIFISFAGIAVLVMGSSPLTAGDRGSLGGDILILGAVVTAALYTILARDLGKSHSPLTITGFQSFFGALFYGPFFIFQASELQWRNIGIQPLAALVYLVIFATIGAFYLYNYALSWIPAARASVFINGIPVVTTLAAWPLLHERLTPVQLLGGLLVLFAVALANTGFKTRSPSGL
jgi:drug/metabolite transporter (DMT)-like permease